VRRRAPHLGGVGPEVPEIARTAAVIEALAPIASTPDEHTAIDLARGFLTRHQLNGADYAMTRDPAWVTGAFPVSPIIHFLQIDVTAHALLALVPS
jgi:hypothetical protein